MKKVISIILVLACLISPASAFAASQFDRSALEPSSHYSYDYSTREWSFASGYYREYSNASIMVYLVLFQDYIDEGLGPELRVLFYDKETDHMDDVLSFQADVDGVLYCFDNLMVDSNGGGSVFGGNVLREFLSALTTAKEIAFSYVHENAYGKVYTGTDSHVHTGEAAELAKAGQYINKSKAWTADSDPDYKDEYFEAYIIKK